MTDTLLRWTDPNYYEQGYDVYRSNSPIDRNNLPPALASLGPDVTEFLDTDTVLGDPYHYAVAAKYQDEVKPDWVSKSQLMLGGNASLYLDWRLPVYRGGVPDLSRLTAGWDFNDAGGGADAVCAGRVATEFAGGAAGAGGNEFAALLRNAGGRRRVEQYRNFAFGRGPVP